MKRTMKFKHIFILLGLFAFASCEDRLDLEPKQSISGDAAIESESNIARFLVGVYDEAGQGASYGGTMPLMADLLGSSEYITWGGTHIQPREVVNKSITTTNAFVGNFWSNAYESINQANIIIDNINVVTSSEEEKNRIEGEARFLRALSYFDLDRFFASNGKSVPLRTEGILDYSIDLNIARSSSDEVYALVEDDLKKAVNLLPETNSFFADKYAAQALLARVYLQKGQYALARDAANDVISNSNHTLSSTFAEAFNHDSDGPEDLFSFQVTSQTGTNVFIRYYADEQRGGRGGDITINDNYVDLFEDGDARKTYFYASAQNGGRLTSKYTNQFGNLPTIRLAEMLLIRAEANLAEGTEVGATPLEDVNAVRARSGASALESVDIDAIMMERVLELAFEGYAIHDLKRTQRSVGSLSWDAPELVLPIPQGEMDTNTLMEQNPGY